MLCTVSATPVVRRDSEPVEEFVENEYFDLVSSEYYLNLF